MVNREDTDSVEEFELNEKSAGLEEAINETLQQRQLKEVREEQENDARKMERITEWFKEN